jgi:hypothetical protein
MLMRQTCIGLLIGVSCLAAGLTQASAQIDVPGPGRVITSAFAPVPAGTAILVRALDDSTDNLRLKTNIESALTARSWRLGSANSPLRLDFETEYQALGASVPGSSRRVRPGPITEPEGAFKRGTQTENTVIVGDPPDGRGGLRYVLSASIHDQRTGQQLWQGEASYDGVPSDEQAVMRAMVPILLDRIGRTVRREPFRIN